MRLWFTSYVIVVCILLAPFAPAAHVYPDTRSIDDSSTSIIIIGDTQHTSHWEFWRERNVEATQRLAAEMARRHPAFILHLGDMTARGSSESHREYFDNDIEPVRKGQIPIFPVLGNHDYYGDDNLALRNIRQRFPVLKKSLWYSFTHHGIGFIMLNSNFSDLKRDDIRRQKEWYDATLKRMEKDDAISAILVCCHHPPYTNSEVISPSKGVERDFAEPFLKCKKTAFFFSGHCHSYERFEKGGKIFIVSGGGGGPRHRLDIDKKHRKFDDRFDGPAVRFFQFCELVIHGDHLDLRVIRLKGDGTFDVADECRI
ncbi:MAG: metallophosphoesterase [Candidatus Sumerlaeota bacterium]|nr:metallophosphoesterase [Candidatus Sumerlaeota bacterium]